jgi:HNH endonuclease
VTSGSDLLKVYESRIKPRVDFNGPVPPDPWRPVEGGCWLWTGGRFPAGYGSISIGNETHLVHRVVYQAIHGPIPDDLFVDHICRVRACIRHLELVTPAENMIRSQRGYCRKGHAMTETNTFRPSTHPTQRLCRICRAESSRRYRERRATRREAA